jgi:hypothetical protein
MTKPNEKEQEKKSVQERLDAKMKKVDADIKRHLASIRISQLTSNYDLVFERAFPSHSILLEIYNRLEEGRKAIEENKRIKASLDAVANQISKMFNLV